MTSKYSQQLMTTRDTRTCSTLEDFSMKQWKFQGNNRKYQTDVA